MTDEARDAHTVLSFGKEGYLFRRIPQALGIGCLGVVFSILRDNADAKDQLAAFILVTAGFGYIAFALWRQWSPAEPTLVLSPRGIRYRFTSRHTFVIPWDAVQDVASADIRMGSTFFFARERDVPVVFVSETFYRSRIHIGSLWEQGPGWRYQFIPKHGFVQIAFFHDVFSQPASDLRAAIEERWRFFSRNPNTRMPSRPAPAAVTAGWLTGRQKRVVVVAATLLAAPLLWNWQWGAAWLRSAIPEGSRRGYLERLLAGPGLPARTADGAMLMVRRRDVARIGTSECHKRIERDVAARGWVPAYDASWQCLADLQLRSGAGAVAAFLLVIERFGQHHPAGDHRRGSSVVTAPLSLDAAERQVCALRGCR